MKWKVDNALSRDVERQQLNKILKEIKAKLETVTAPPPVVRPPTPTPPSRTPVTVTLTGDVTGTATGTGTITIDTTLEASVGGLQDAPDDGGVYWRGSQQWQQVPLALQFFYDISGSGFLSYNEDGVLTPRVIEGEAGQIDVADGDGVDANPLLSLADVGNTGAGQLLEIEVDSKGRVVGYRPLGVAAITDQDGLVLTDQEGNPLSDNAPGGIGWDRIVDTPTTLAGYGITDGATDAELAAALAAYQPTFAVFPVGSLPSPSPAARTIFVTGAAGSPGAMIPAYTDGTLWRRYSDDSELP